MPVVRRADLDGVDVLTAQNLPEIDTCIAAAIGTGGLVLGVMLLDQALAGSRPPTLPSQYPGLSRLTSQTATICTRSSLRNELMSLIPWLPVPITATVTRLLGATRPPSPSAPAGTIMGNARPAAVP